MIPKPVKSLVRDAVELWCVVNPSFQVLHGQHVIWTTGLAVVALRIIDVNTAIITFNKEL